MMADQQGTTNISKTALTLSLTNLAKYISFMSPLLITFFMIMISIINNNIVKGLIFTMGLVIITFINYLLKNIIRDKQDDMASPFCNILPSPFTLNTGTTIYRSPSLSSTILGYTTAYLLFPMKINNEVNPALSVFLVALTCVNAYTEYHSLCSSIGGIFLGIIIGMLFGVLFYGIISMSGQKGLAYFTEISSNNTMCKKPSKQKFKCVTYSKKGSLGSNNNQNISTPT